MNHRLQKQHDVLIKLATDQQLIPDDLCEAAMLYTSLCSESLELERVSIWTFDETSSNLTCLDLFSRSGGCHRIEPLRQLSRYPVYLRTLQQEWLIAASNAHTDPIVSEIFDPHLARHKIISLLHIGIRDRGRLIGAICLEHVGPERIWQADEMNFVSNIADQFARLMLEQGKHIEHQALSEQECKYRQLFNDSEIAIWEEDFSLLMDKLDSLRREGVTELQEYLNEHPGLVQQLAKLVKVVAVNPATLRMYDASSEEHMLQGIDQVFTDDSYATFINEICAIWNGDKRFHAECTQRTLSGKRLSATMSMPIPDKREDFAHIPVSFIDNTANKRLQGELLLISHGITPETGDDFFQSLVKSLCETLGVEIALVGKLRVDTTEEKVETVAVYADGKFMDNFIYNLRQTPCEAVRNQQQCTIVKDIQRLYPEDDLLELMGIEAYSGIPLKNAEGEVIGLMVVLSRSPITQAERFESILRIFSSRAAAELNRMQVEEHMNKLSLAVKHSPNVVVITDVSGKIEYVNPKFTSVTGYEQKEALGRSPAMLKSGNTDDHTYKIMWKTLLAGNEWRGELQNRRKTGEIYWVQEVIAPIRNSQGQITHFVAIQEDITEARRISREIRYQASHDMLTGLINRHEFERRLKRVVTTAQEDDSHHVLCFLDLDQFKIVNDSSGHVAGDEMLREVGTLLENNLRQRDTLARIGGDEFAILMEHCGIEQAKTTVESLRQQVEEFRFGWEGSSFTIGVSIGLTLIDASAGNATEVLKKADLACYAAKDAGRNRMHVYQSDDADVVKKQGEFLWVNEIRRALDEDRFCLYAQPIFSLSDPQAPVSHEILLRLRTADGRLHAPGSFLPAAERYNLSHHIDRWVINHIFSWMRQHPGVISEIGHFAINLSGQSLGDEHQLEHIINALSENEGFNNKIVFEITETAAISNLRDASRFINTLKDYGCEFSLDDFGSGLSSFAYLKSLPVDNLKIDGMFVKDILDDPLDEAMVRSINDIGHVMGMRTIGEFVENQEIKQRLAEIGVDYGQGYGLGKPRPIEQLV